MVEFADTRTGMDKQIIADRRADGADPRYKAGEFAAVEIGMAVTTTKHAVHRTVAMTRRLQTECPDA